MDAVKTTDRREQQPDIPSPSYRRIQDLIRDDIVAGRLTPNLHLKTADLATRYGVSANPVREALQRLEGEGLVVILPNRGARVRAIDEPFLRNILDILLLLDPYFVHWFRGIRPQRRHRGARRHSAAARKLRKAGRFHSLPSREWSFSRRHLPAPFQLGSAADR